MTDLDRAIAAAREALAKYWDGDEMSGIGAAVDDLLAALDAARYAAPAAAACDCDWPLLGNCESCAPPDPPRDESIIDIGGESVPRWIVEYANALTTYFAERGGRSWAIGGVQSREQAPPAAVPEGYAAAIKAVQEMMPPRDFRPSAQVWLTGNQVNELHARLDAAAMLAAERKECKV